MGFETSTRKRHFPHDWRKRRQLVLERAGFKCEYVREDTGLRCNAPANQCDHIQHGVDGVYDDALDNLQALCEYHHLVKSKREGALVAHERRRKRLAEARFNHPAYH